MDQNSPGNRPLFSIITVTYNAADTLPATIESVRRQTCNLYEHLIIDGDSSDGTIEIARRNLHPLMRFRSAADRGIYDAMNKGLAEATGDYVIFLNAGDTFHSPDTLQRIADTIMCEDYPGVVYGQTDIVDADRRRIGPRHLTAPEQLSLQSFADGMVVCHQAFCSTQTDHVALQSEIPVLGRFRLVHPRASAFAPQCAHPRSAHRLP